MPDTLFDTNILIHLYEEHPTYLHLISIVGGKTPGISILAYMEMLIGAADDADEEKIRDFLKNFEIVPLTKEVADESASWMRHRKRKSLRHPSLADTIIGHTALSLDIPLITNNPKDFAAFKKSVTTGRAGSLRRAPGRG